MNIAHHMISQEISHPTNAFSNNCRTKMSHMQRLCHIGSAVIHNNGFSMTNFIQPQLRSLSHTFHILCQIQGIDTKIDKSRHYCIDILIQKNRSFSCSSSHTALLLQLCNYIWSNINRFLFIGFCSCHSAIALIFTEIRAVWQYYLGIRFLIPTAGKCRLHFISNQIKKFFHVSCLLLFHSCRLLMTEIKLQTSGSFP